MGSAGGNRAVSETAGVAVLVLLTVSVTAAVGLSVIFAADSGPPEADFSFEQIGDRVLITHDGGDEFSASNLVISGPDGELTWAENAEVEPSTAVGPGDATQIGPPSPYGSRLRADDYIQIRYAPGEGNQTVLAERGQRDSPVDVNA
ncbi:type IV pilin [Halovenus marina]|uniref:type IV pilin n=1 Tax=Halovenus marina TaxID=3396621 RepID=UPI003F577063